MDALEQWLERRNDPADGMVQDQPGVEAAAWDRFAERLTESLRGASDAGGHLTLAELRQFAEQRRTGGGEWTMPPHLSGCPVCLEAFEALVAGGTDISSAGRARFLGLFDELRPRRSPILLYLPRLAAAAAVLVLAYAGVVTYAQRQGTVPFTVASGLLHAPGGEAVAGSTRVPAGQEYLTRQPTRIIMDGGIVVDIAGDSRLAFRTVARNSIVDLSDGTVSVMAPPLANGRHFTVSTRLGDVVIVGTSFSVACRNERAVEYTNDGRGSVSSRPIDVTSVAVVVSEGTVQVRGRDEVVLVGAGYRAVLRAGEPKVEVTETTP